MLVVDSRKNSLEGTVNSGIGISVKSGMLIEFLGLYIKVLSLII